MVDGVEAAHVVALNFVRREQFVDGQAVEHLGGLVERCAQPVKQLRGRTACSGRELGRAVALVFDAVERSNQPLAHVAVQMQQQIADAVRGFVGPPPDLLRRSAARRIPSCAANTARGVSCARIRERRKRVRFHVASSRIALNTVWAFPGPQMRGTGGTHRDCDAKQAKN